MRSSALALFLAACGGKAKPAPAPPASTDHDDHDEGAHP